MFSKKVIKSIFIFTGLSLAASQSFAGAGGGGLAGLMENIIAQVKSIVGLLSIISYVAGIGFVLSGIIKFRAHQMNPQQTPLQQPITMVVVGACLLFLPSVVNVAGSSVLGSDAKSAAEGFNIQ